MGIAGDVQGTLFCVEGLLSHRGWIWFFLPRGWVVPNDWTGGVDPAPQGNQNPPSAQPYHRLGA